MGGEGAHPINGGSHLSKEKAFLVFALETARTVSDPILTNENVLSEFGPEALMRGFEDDPDKRGALIERTAGTKKLLAKSYSVEHSTATLKQALEIEVTDADEIFSIVTAEDLVRTQDPKRIWNLLYNNGWLIEETEGGKNFMKLLLAEILKQELLGPTTPLTIFDKFGPMAFVSDRMPEEDRASIIAMVMERGEPLLRKARPDSSSMNSEEPKPFTAKHLIKTITVQRLVEFNPLSLLVRVLDELALMHRWVEPPAETVPPPAEEEDEDDDGPELMVSTPSEMPEAPLGFDESTNGEPKHDEDETLIHEQPSLDEEADAAETSNGPPPLPKRKKSATTS